MDMELYTQDMGYPCRYCANEAQCLQEEEKGALYPFSELCPYWEQYVQSKAQ